MKGFIELTIQGRRRLIAINAIVGITERPTHQSCAINLVAPLIDVNRRGLPPHGVKGTASLQIETEQGITYEVVKKLIEDNQ